MQRDTRVLADRGDLVGRQGGRARPVQDAVEVTALQGPDAFGDLLGVADDFESGLLGEGRRGASRNPRRSQ